MKRLNTAETSVKQNGVVLLKGPEPTERPYLILAKENEIGHSLCSAFFLSLEILTSCFFSVYLHVD